MIRVFVFILISTIFLKANEEVKYYQELHNAVRSDNMEILELSLKKFNNFINEKDQFGSTPLLLAVRKNHIDMVEAILKYKANVNIADKFGDTPLIESARNNNMEILKLLICADAKKDIKNKYAQSAMDFISKNKQYETALFLQDPKCENNDIIDKKTQLLNRLRELE